MGNTEEARRDIAEMESIRRDAEEQEDIMGQRC